LKTGTS
jgi:hypothetical protein